MDAEWYACAITTKHLMSSAEDGRGGVGTAGVHESGVHMSILGLSPPVHLCACMCSCLNS